jgi:hypothetical protein
MNRSSIIATSQKIEPHLKLNTNKWPFWVVGIAHIPLVLLMNQFDWLATIHAITTVLLGIFYLTQKNPPENFLYVTGYIVGAEILWRMTNANVFWEFGKYSLVLLFGLAILKWRLNIRILPLMYFLPLLPSILITMEKYELSRVRDAISFNLSGPFTLFIAVTFFLQIKINFVQVRTLFEMILTPIVGISGLLLFQLVNRFDTLAFTNLSNWETSGGFGPNQVSAILGLGTLLCWLIFLLKPPSERERWFIVGIGAILLFQAFLTFSRGGVFNIFIALPFATYFMMRANRKVRSRVFWSLILLGLLFVFLLPQLDLFTNELLFVRFSSINTTGREELAKIDFAVWLDHLSFGVGPGGIGDFYKQIRGRRTISHTEFSRMLAEHGAFGLLSLLILIIILIRAFTKSRLSIVNGIVLALILWSFAEMTHSAMRIAAIPYLIALATATIFVRE